jgi:hypothetical protein
MNMFLTDKLVHFAVLSFIGLHVVASVSVSTIYHLANKDADTDVLTLV